MAQQKPRLSASQAGKSPDPTRHSLCLVVVVVVVVTVDDDLSPGLTPTPHLDSLDTGIVASGMRFIGHVAVQALLCEDWGLGPRHHVRGSLAVRAAWSEATGGW